MSAEFFKDGNKNPYLILKEGETLGLSLGDIHTIEGRTNGFKFWRQTNGWHYAEVGTPLNQVLLPESILVKAVDDSPRKF